MMNTTTRTGLRVVCELAKKEYPCGVKANPEFLADEATLRDKLLPACNYKFSPH